MLAAGRSAYWDESHHRNKLERENARWRAFSARVSGVLASHKIDGGAFPALALLNVEGQLLPIRQSRHSRTRERGDMNEDVLGTIVRLNKAVALLRVEPLNRTLSHVPLHAINSAYALSHRRADLGDRTGEPGSTLAADELRT